MFSSDIVEAISIYKVSDLPTVCPTLIGEEARMLLNKIDGIEEWIASLRAKLKREEQFNRKMELNIEIKEC